MRNNTGRTTWNNRLALALVILAPILVKLPLILGLRIADPTPLYSRLASELTMAHPGNPTLDPNIAFTSQTLGHRAALDLLSGHLPWWNYFQGVGMPLAGEMQSAALFPLTPLLALPNGQLYMHIILQIIAGVFTVLLMRRLGAGKVAATLAGVLYEFNGTYAWLANAVINPIAFLPMILLGVEAVRARFSPSHDGLVRRAAGWYWIPIGLALSLYAGFPETAYLNGLLIGVWTLVRLIGLGSARVAARYLSSVAGGAVVGMLLAAPILIAFTDFLLVANVGGHSGDGFRHMHLQAGNIVNLTLPYLFGHLGELPVPVGNGAFWGNVGGYAGMALVALGLVGAAGALRDGTYRALRLALAAWAAVTMTATYGAPVITPLVTSIPAVGTAAFFRYFCASWQFSLSVLAGFAVQDLATASVRRPGWEFWTGLAAAFAVTVAALTPAAPTLVGLPLTPWFQRSLMVGEGVLGGLALLGGLPLATRRRAMLVAILAGLEAMLLFIVPLRSLPSAAVVDTRGVTFLQNHLGQQRFYSLGPVTPNYGAYFGIAGINHNDMPLPRAWVDHVVKHLDDNTIDVLFTGFSRASASGPTALENLLRNLDAYRQLGVKYVLGGPTNANDWTPPGSAAQQNGNSAAPLPSDGHAAFTLPLPDHGVVTQVGILVGTYGRKSDGLLTVKLCVADTCAQGSAVLDHPADNTYFPIPLDSGLPVNGGHARLELQRTGGTQPLAVWMYPVQPDGIRTQALDGGFAFEEQAPKLSLTLSADGPLRPVFRDSVMTVYELDNATPYFTAEGCTLDVQSREALVANCPAAAALRRLELAMAGWSATVNGVAQSVAADGPLFQRVELPAGWSVVTFHFRPPFMPLGYALFLLGLVSLAASTWWNRQTVTRT
ncbi:hypothetical protein FBZ87_11045 [Nitrospirillum amazonense]|uniref:4-amino-4-deoxy-L-arabinose transferase-like glycosyltransferase n=1 Tax=Nitrospirillum amazonense TaxID=28077 RepID=A0A560JCG7_9PROT|nr:YfhO family protein [Nitrospirillum amazonense]TWB68736.1 hypothetical protein FBZ87_11045 [Nitrospirillum amazonense]